MANPNKYSDPALRERLKKKILKGGKGGDPGEWSARKAQLLVQEYKRAGGRFLGPRDESQKSLQKWTKEDWGTFDGGKSEGRKRYLPRAVREKLTPPQKKAADRTKAAGDQAGKQFVANPKSVRQAAAKVRGTKKR